MRSVPFRMVMENSVSRRSVPVVPYLVAIVVGLAVTGCMSLDLGRPLQPDTRDWLSQGGSEYRQHYVDESLAFPLEQKWRYNAHAGFGPGSPLMIEETVFVSSRNGQVHALSLHDGDRRGREEFGESIEGTPVVTDSTLYIPVSWEKPEIVAYDLVAGKINWRRRGTAVETGLSLRGNLLYAADVEGRVTAFDRANGDTVWTSPSDSLVSYRAAPVIVDERLIVVDDRGRVRALDVQSGAVEWERSLPEPVDHAPAVLGETIYIPSVRGTLWAIDATTGRVQWEYRAEEQPRRFATPAVSEHMLLLPGSDGTVRRLNPENGDLVWTKAVGGPITAAPLLLQNAVIVGSMNASVYGLDLASGDVLWTATVEGRIKSAPVLKERHLIILAEPSHVYAFAPKASDSVALSDSSDAP